MNALAQQQHDIRSMHLTMESGASGHDPCLFSSGTKVSWQCMHLDFVPSRRLEGLLSSRAESFLDDGGGVLDFDLERGGWKTWVVEGKPGTDGRMFFSREP